MRLRNRIFIGLLFILTGTLFGFIQDSDQSVTILNNVAHLKQYRSKRISSYDRSGKNADRLVIKSGETAELASIEGAGIIKHIWVTISSQDPMLRRNGILRMYWDGEQEPSVESPIGDFFGQGWGEKYNFISLPLAVAPKDGNALNCYFPMPFSNGALITVENQSEKKIDAFYYYIDYEEHDTISPELGRFHAFWNRELTEPLPDGENEWSILGPQAANTDGAGNYIFADIEGKGHFVGVNYYVDSPSPVWYGEGDDMFFIDGEKWPSSIHGTGTEDFFNSSEKSLKATIEHGHNNCLTLDLVTVAYWYQKEPHKTFPEMRPKEERQNMPAIGPVEMHRWRDAWRRAHGNKKLWGNERK